MKKMAGDGQQYFEAGSIYRSSFRTLNRDSGSDFQHNLDKSCNAHHARC